MINPWIGTGGSGWTSSGGSGSGSGSGGTWTCNLCDTAANFKLTRSQSGARTCGELQLLQMLLQLLLAASRICVCARRFTATVLQ